MLTHAMGAIPQRLFDTQVAAGFVGYGTPSLTSLLQGELGITPPKGDRLTDWLRRPLTDAQCEYAAADVASLLDLHDRLVAELAELGRLAWAEDACEELRCRPTGAIDPEMAWLKLKDARSLRSKARAVAQAVAAWREREAAATDTPVRQVLPDLAILGIAQRQPATLDELAQARGVDERHRRGRLGRELLAAVAAGKDGPTADRARRRRRARPQQAAGRHAGVGVGQPGRPRRPHRHRPARHQGRSAGRHPWRRRTPASPTGGAPSWSATGSPA